jgi:hypothetical protein
MDPIRETKEVPRERWQDFCVTFTGGNQGRGVYITFISQDIGEPLAKATIFSAIDYDPVGKGYDFVISYGSQATLTAHVVTSPYVLFRSQDENGKVVVLVIVDLNDDRTLLTFN